MTVRIERGETTRAARARRALERQLAYQRVKAARAAGHEDEYVAAMRARSAVVRVRLEAVRPVAPEARVLGVGSGVHGLVFYFGRSGWIRGMSVEPLACD